MEELHRGAEAILYRDGDELIKIRPLKDFRWADIDTRLRTTRTRREAKILNTLAKNNIPVPKLLHVDEPRSQINMEFIEGHKLCNILDQDPRTLGFKFGGMVGRIHALDVIHGDLTTSNAIVRNNELVMIDFGLSFVSRRIEDKAVDLRVLERALASRHYDNVEECFTAVLEGYRRANPEHEQVLNQFETVQSRGRNKRK